jgi:hypothetical protein
MRLSASLTLAAVPAAVVMASADGFLAPRMPGVKHFEYRCDQSW